MSLTSLFHRAPGWRRMLLLRRLLAAGLGLAACTLGVLSFTHQDPTVVVLNQPVAAGTILEPEHLGIRRLSSDKHPDKVILGTDKDEVAGKILASSGVAGEILHSNLLVGPELINSLSPGGTMVPLKLADPDLASLLVQGDTVSVVTINTVDEKPVVVAEGARVVATPPDEHSSSVLIALEDSQATAVATAALRSPLAVIVTGPRGGKRK
ncbi:SAF domain-containing protein [Corynebacterium poyangense]|nr:SAF domain-containing protein [Corynebacterium poyangense]